MQTAFDKIAAGLNDAIRYQRALRDDVPGWACSDALALSVAITAILVAAVMVAWG